VRVADGPPQRIKDKGQQHLPGNEAWLIGEQRMSGEKKYYLANLPAKTDLQTLAATIKARCICEQAHQQLTCATPSSNSSLDYRRSDARIAKNGFATSSAVSKCAKVVLGQGVNGAGNSRESRFITLAKSGGKCT
jgi:hypothetical protein